MKTKAGKDTYPIPEDVYDILNVTIEHERFRKDMQYRKSIQRVPQVDVMAKPRQRGVPQIYCLNRNTSTISVWPIPDEPMRMEVYYLTMHKA